MTFDASQLQIVHYPSAGLRKRAAAVRDFDDGMRALIARMFEVMRQERGVGLAAPQVGVPLRIFVMNATGDARDDLALINPVLSDQEGSAEAEEGCLSLPGVTVHVRRAVRARLKAIDQHGHPIELIGQDLVARIWQHEIDHLDGVLIIDRMGPGDELATRKALRTLEEAAPPPVIEKKVSRAPRSASHARRARRR
ncbi:MAG: peptide deformylase [Phycisphaerales bacterium]|nr:peptide deformylase [Phycisphaerales bacterium]